eukprot:225055-Pleurochrysis_carterae.AAC.1
MTRKREVARVAVELVQLRRIAQTVLRLSLHWCNYCEREGRHLRAELGQCETSYNQLINVTSKLRLDALGERELLSAKKVHRGILYYVGRSSLMQRSAIFRNRKLERSA